MGSVEWWGQKKNSEPEDRPIETTQSGCQREK